jgi:hypothetical protein
MLGSSSSTVLATEGFAPVMTEKQTVYISFFFTNIEINDYINSIQTLTIMKNGIF